MKRPPNPTSAAALYVLVRSVRPLARHLGRGSAAAGEGGVVPAAMRAVLERLYEGGAQTVPQLARALGTRRQASQRVVDEAAAEGLVERVENAAHRRSVLVRLTEAGRRRIGAILAGEFALLETLADRFAADDVEAATRVLQGLAAALAAPVPGGEDGAGAGGEAPTVSGSAPRARPRPPTG